MTFLRCDGYKLLPGNGIPSQPVPMLDVRLRSQMIVAEFYIVQGSLNYVERLNALCIPQQMCSRAPQEHAGAHV